MALLHLFQNRDWNTDILGNYSEEIVLQNLNESDKNEYAIIKKKKYRFLPFYSLRITFGPVINYDKSESISQMLEKIKELAKNTKAVSIEFNPYVWEYDSSLTNLLEANKFVKTSDYVYKNSIIVDLSLSEEELFKQFERRGQKAVRQSVDRGVRVELTQLNAASFDTFYHLYKTTCSRTQFIPEDYFSLKKQLLYWHSKSKVYLFFAYFEEKVIGSLLLFNNEDSVSTVYQGNDYDPEMMNKRASNAMYWETMKWAKANGFKCYDFGGITVSESYEEEKKEGIHNFKTQFGGKIVSFPGNYIYVNRPFPLFFIKMIQPIYSLIALSRAKSKAFKS